MCHCVSSMAVRFKLAIANPIEAPKPAPKLLPHNARLPVHVHALLARQHARLVTHFFNFKF